MKDKISINDLVDFNNTLLRYGKQIVDKHMRAILSNYNSVDCDLHAGEVSVFCEITETDDAGIHNEKRLLEVVKYDIQLNHFYIRMYPNSQYKLVLDDVFANKDGIWELVRLYVTICRLTS